MNREDEALKVLTVLLRASGSVTNMLKNDMKSYGLNPTEFAVLEVLYNQGALPIQEIRSSILLASSSITYVIDQLEKKGLIKRVQKKEDRRVTLVSLSIVGHDLMEDIFPQHTELINDLFADLTDEELIVLHKTLKTIGYNAQDLFDKLG